MEVEVKYTILGGLIYGTMLLYLAAAILLLCGKKRAGMVLYGLGFHVAMLAFVLRWREVDHAPLQNMFEVFLTLGMLIFPITLFCRLFLRVGGEAGDAIVGIIVLFPAGFVFSAEPQNLPAALQTALFIPHVAAYMISYVILAKAGLQAFKCVRVRTRWALLVLVLPRLAVAVVPAMLKMTVSFPHNAGLRGLAAWLFGPSATGGFVFAGQTLGTAAVVVGALLDIGLTVLVVYLFATGKEISAEAKVMAERAAYRTTKLGFPLLTLGLVLGAWWAKICWGDYWGWDPKELWSLISWLVFVGYFHFRYMFGTRYPRVNTALVVSGLVAIVLTLVWLNLSSIFESVHSYA